MTSKERVLTAMRRGQPDRVPINMRGVRVWGREWVATRDVSSRAIIDAVQEHCDIIPHAWVPGLGLPLFTEAMKEITEVKGIEAGDGQVHRTIGPTPKG